MNQLPTIHVCLIHPLGYAHGDALLDPALYFSHQLERFGGEVSFERNRLRHGAVNFIFGAHNGFDAELCQRYSCVFVNLEQIGAGGANLAPNYFRLLAGSAVVDYDRANPPAYTSHPDDVPVVSFGHAPYLAAADCLPLEERPIDVLFFGSLNERRLGLIRKIEAAGRKVTLAPIPCYGDQRDALIRQAKCVVNMPFYESARFEQVRAFLCLSLGTPMLSERRVGSHPPSAYEPCVTWFDEQQIDQLFGRDFGTPAFFNGLREQLAAFEQVDPIDSYAEVACFAAGVWQVHAQTAIGQTTADAYLHGAAPASPRQGLPRKPGPLFQYLDEQAHLIDWYMDAERHSEALAAMALAVHKHFCQPSVTHHALYYPDFDRQIEQLATTLQASVQPVAPVDVTGAADDAADVTLIVATELYDVGGHSRVVEDVARVVKRPVLVLTDLFSNYKNGRLDKAWVHRRLPGVEVIFLDDTDSLWEKCLRIATLAAGLPLRNVLYFQHHQDPLPFVGTWALPGVRKLLVHHCDHNPSLGCTLEGVLHVDLSTFLQGICTEHLGQPAHLLPLHVPDRGRRSPDAGTGGKLSVVTSGRPGKFALTGAVALHEIASTVLKVVDGQFYFVGPLEPQWLELIRRHLTSRDIDPDRFVPLGLVPSLWDTLLKLDAALYLGSAPIGGGRAAIEAQGVGLPVLYFSGIEQGTLIENYSVYANPQLGWSGLEELAKLLNEAGPSRVALSDQARRYYENQFSEQHFVSELTRILGEAAMP